MKKILLATAAAAVLSSASAYAAEDMFYLKVNGGWSKMNKIQSHKSKNSGFAGAAAGYYVGDNARVELAFDHFLAPTHESNIKTNVAANATAVPPVVAHTTAAKTKIKGKVNSLLLNGFVDV